MCCQNRCLCLGFTDSETSKSNMTMAACHFRCRSTVIQQDRARLETEEHFITAFTSRLPNSPLTHPWTGEWALCAAWAYCPMPSHVHIILVPSDADGLRRTAPALYRVLYGLCQCPCQGHRPFVTGTSLFGGVMVTGCAPAPMPGKRVVPGLDRGMWNASLTINVSWAALSIQPLLPPIVLSEKNVLNEIQVADCWPAISFSRSPSHCLFR